MKRRPTLRDVAKGADVHPATASRALNPETRSLVNTRTAERVLRVARSLGYRPNPHARTLKTARSATVGLVIPDLTNPLFPPIARGVEDVLGQAGYSAWIVNTDNDEAREVAAVDSLELGHRKIVHLAGPQTLSTGRGRLRGYQHALADHGLANDPKLVIICDAFTEDAGVKALHQLLDDGVEFTAVLAGNDLLAAGCYDALTEHGLACPDDISVVGFNDTQFMDKLRPPLTTVRIPHYEIGAEAARLLLEELRSPERHPRSILLPLSLVVRQSTAPPAN